MTLETSLSLVTMASTYLVLTMLAVRRWGWPIGLILALTVIPVLTYFAALREFLHHSVRGVRGDLDRLGARSPAVARDRAQ